MAAMAQYGDTRTLNSTEKPLFAAAAQSAIKVPASHRFRSSQKARASWHFQEPAPWNSGCTDSTDSM